MPTGCCGLPGPLGVRACGVGQLLRIHFTLDDLARVRVLGEPHPLWEVLLSLHMLQTQQGAIVFGGWRRSARAALPLAARQTLWPALVALARPRGYSPDFLTPPVETADLDVALEAFLATERTVLRADIGVLAAEATLPKWAGRVAEGETGTLQGLAEAIRRYHRTVLAPYWPVIGAHVRESRAKQAELAVSAGLEHVLGTLHSRARWRGQVLELPYPVDQELRLDGRGLTLVPSFFCWENPITLADPRRPPVLVYPVDRDLGWTGARAAEESRPDRRSLVALLGRTRAAVLLTIAERPRLTTTELAAVLGTSPASASQHATVLREAGLVTTRRHNGFALHALTARGTVLLAQPYDERSA